MIQVSGYLGNPKMADARWQKIPVTSWVHYLVEVNGKYIDLTGSQLGSNVQIFNHDDIVKLWQKAYVTSFNDAWDGW